VDSKVNKIIIPVLASVLILGTFSGLVVFADDDDDDLSSLRCQIEQVMTGILFEDDDEIIDVICESQIEGPQGPKGDKGDPGEPGTGGALSCENQIEIKRVAGAFQLDEECKSGYDLGISVDFSNIRCREMRLPEPAVCLVTISNSGPKPATDVSFTFRTQFDTSPHPFALTLVAINCAEPQECFVGDIPAGESVIFEVQFTTITNNPNLAIYFTDFFVPDDTYALADPSDNRSFTLQIRIIR